MLGVAVLAVMCTGLRAEPAPAAAASVGRQAGDDGCSLLANLARDPFFRVRPGRLVAEVQAELDAVLPAYGAGPGEQGVQTARAQIDRLRRGCAETAASTPIPGEVAAHDASQIWLLARIEQLDKERRWPALAALPIELPRSDGTADARAMAQRRAPAARFGDPDPEGRSQRSKMARAEVRAEAAAASKKAEARPVGSDTAAVERRPAADPQRDLLDLLKGPGDGARATRGMRPASAPQVTSSDYKGQRPASPTPAPVMAPAVVTAAVTAASSATTSATEPAASSVLQPAKVAWNTPPKMAMGDSAEVELRVTVDPRLFPGLESRVRAAGTTASEQIALTRDLSAKLESTAFEVKPEGLVRQTVRDGRDATWSWIISPKSKGRHRLLLSLTSAVSDGPQVDPMVRVIEVTASADASADAAVGFVAAHWDKLWTLILIPAAAWGWQRWTRQRTRQRVSPPPSISDSRPGDAP